MHEQLYLTPAAQILAGVLLLLVGRRLFWLFVGVIGFFIGAEYGSVLFAGLNDVARVLLALGMGILGVVLAIFLQRLAVTLAGALAGGMLAIRIAPELGLHTDAGAIVAFVAGALLAAVLLTVIFDPALIVLTVLLGAVMVCEGLPLEPSIYALTFVALTVLGFFLQARLFRASQTSR